MCITTLMTFYIQAFEFAVPKDCDLTFVPHVGEIQAKSNMRVQIEFTPKIDPAESAAAPPSPQTAPSPPSAGAANGGKTTAAASKKLQDLEKLEEGDGRDEAEGENSELDKQDVTEASPPTPWYRWKQWSVSCYLRPPVKGRSASSGGTPEPSSSEDPLQGSLMREIQQLHLNIETCAIQPDVVLKTELPWVSL